MKEYLSKLQKIINQNLEETLEKNKNNTYFDDMMKYAVLLGGKRIRPIIMYILADIYNKEYEMIEKEAQSIELIHAYSLVHDDLPCMDNDEYRRGNLTVHKKFGVANAVLVGDSLLTLAFLVLAESDYSNKNSVITLSYYSGNKGMILGQYLDILSEGKDISLDQLLDIHISKTAMLLMASVELACISLKLDIDVRKILRKYILYLGLAYQIQDDILEIEGNFEKTGKLNTDFENEKSTCPSIIGIEKSKIMCKTFTDKAIDLVQGNEKLIEFANFLLKREG
ncbi:polyprenyl synthetase family protein [Pseudostreptobacillus hongkongensis]|uniref:polyprenyl synthetase family protein n=1 Tax=Pseudostreptobacillus hongkongensis TaxID=1162717 RepID=UPI00082FDDBF|nr:polyprenyl synthetase family protein [Pseudostreptobacillus hongkongensis]